MDDLNIDWLSTCPELIAHSGVARPKVVVFSHFLVFAARFPTSKLSSVYVCIQFYLSDGKYQDILDASYANWIIACIVTHFVNNASVKYKICVCMYTHETFFDHKKYAIVSGMYICT